MLGQETSRNIATRATAPAQQAHTILISGSSSSDPSSISYRRVTRLYAYSWKISGCCLSSLQKSICAGSARYTLCAVISGMIANTTPMPSDASTCPDCGEAFGALGELREHYFDHIFLLSRKPQTQQPRRTLRGYNPMHTVLRDRINAS